MYAPVTDRSVEFFHVKSTTPINGLLIAFEAAYIPGALLTPWMFINLKFRKTMCIATILLALGASLKYLGSLGHVSDFIFTMFLLLSMKMLIVLCVMCYVV